MATTERRRTTTRTMIPGFRGQLIGESHPAYDDTRKLFNAMIDRRPALIARCTDAGDVAAALRWARERDLPISVRGGGHGVAGFALCEGGVVLDMRPMNRVSVDSVARTARAEAGATWGDMDAATQTFGLATTGGRISTTGIAGQTMGSGSGWLERKHGFTVDNLIGAELVTADGELVRASECENPELLWGLRGAGGNFGVLTSLDYRLHSVGPVVLGGLMLFRSEVGSELLRFWRDFMEASPEEVGSAVVCVTAPAAPFVPEDLHGRPAIGMFVAYFGPVDEGDAVLRPLREHAGLAVDLIEPVPYTAIQRLLDPMCPPGQRQYWKSENLAEFSDGANEVILERAEAVTSPFTQLLIEPKSGACSRVPERATPLSRRHAYTYGAFAVWDEPEESERHIAWARETWRAMKPFAIPGVVLNYTSDTGEERVRSTFGPEKYERLVALKDRWDPDNVFRSNQNIRPSVRAAA
jgi:FAD/FMN-containing dehydrogenase